jgi:hypothetical protein
MKKFILTAIVLFPWSFAVAAIMAIGAARH